MVQASTTSVAAVLAAAGAWLGYEYYRRHNDAEQGGSIPESVQAMLGDNSSLINRNQARLIQQLVQAGQKAIFDGWPEAGTRDNDKRSLIKQLQHLDGNYAGGLAAYLRNAKRLLKDAQDGKNPYDGFTPSVPSGTKLDYGSPQYLELEREGIGASRHAAFVLVAGGLGERLGYSDIKIKLPVDSVRGASFLQEYIESILALQRKHGRNVKLPLAIMTSGDTHDKTLAFLEENKYFGADKSQVTLMKQEKVACLRDSDGNLALDPEDQFKLQTKPHGHGDVHALLHSTGLAKKWKQQGVKWIAYFQDTNALVFRGLIPALGVSARHDYDMNSLAVPRKAGEAIGGIACLTHQDGRKMTINVEYNQLDPLLRATTHPDGDTNDDSGYSPFPGNINQLIIKLESYLDVLQKTHGIVAEFVNPKYTDSSKAAFKSPTRLECMMQDYSLALPSSANVGFTTINQVWAAYSPVKNNPKDAQAKAASGGPSHSATSGELDMYEVNCRALQQLGANIQGPQEKTFNGLNVKLYPKVSWSPLFAVTVSDIQNKVDAKNVTLSEDSTLVVKGQNVRINGLDLDGTLLVDVGEAASLTVQHAKVENGGWRLQPNKEGPGKRPATEEEKMRGFLLCKRDAEELEFETGQHTFPDEQKESDPSGSQTQPAYA